MSLCIGIDGGGTRATALVVDAEGRPLARVEGEAGLVLPDRPEAGVDALVELAARALQAAAGDAAPASAAALCCALAGAGRESTRVAVERALLARRVASRVHVTTDAEAGLVDAFGNGAGILLVAGTGSIAWGRGPDGGIARTGGWGTLLGDEGSGYAIGLAGLRAWLRAADGRGAETGLTERIPAALGTDSPDVAVSWVATASKAEIAALAPCVLEAGATGDAVADRILGEAVGALIDHVVGLHHRLGPWPGAVPLALTGGLIAPGRALRTRLEEALRATGLHLDVLQRAIDGARGAATLARVL